MAEAVADYREVAYSRLRRIWRFPVVHLLLQLLSILHLADRAAGRWTAPPWAVTAGLGGNYVRYLYCLLAWLGLVLDYIVSLSSIVE